MSNKNQLQITKDPANKRITVIRSFDAPVEDVWRAWTESELLDQWWAPKPYRAETKRISFKEGGHWLYAMVGPDNSKHWSKVEFVTIKNLKSFTSVDAFCDEDGNITNEMPAMNWRNEFVAEAGKTKVVVEISFNKEEDLQKIMDMGFEQGFTAALGNLEHYLSTGFMLRKQNKKSNAARVATYLNFPGTTEEAFNFYKNVFHGEFTGKGLQRFGDIEMPAGSPAMSDADKKLIIHAELSIIAGHVLMATDAPESMGFKMEYGNNMHINIEPETRQETERLFRELSEGGEVSMPLEDMFWGAYFASFKDKYGINWMLNHQTADNNP